MDDLIPVVGFGTTVAFVIVGLLIVRRWMLTRHRQHAYLALAVGTIVLVAVLGRFRFAVDGFDVALRYASVVAFVASGYGFMLFRHSLFPIARNVLLGLLATVVGLGVFALATGLPEPGRAPSLVEFAALLAVVGAWVACVAEPIGKFWVEARRRPAVQRARLRALAAGYAMILGAVVTLLVGWSLSEGGIALARQIVVLVSVPVLWAAFEPPGWLRRAWREVEEQALRQGMHDLLTFTSDRRLLAGRALNWALRLAGADAGFIAGVRGPLASRHLTEARLKRLESLYDGCAGPAVVKIPDEPDRYLLTLPLGESEMLGLISDPVAPVFGSDEIQRLTAYAAAVATALERSRLDQALADETSRFESLLHAVSDLGQGLVITDGERFVYTNVAFCELTGRSEHDLLSTPPTDVIAPADRDVVAELEQRRMRGDRVPNHYETTLVRPDGRRVDVEVAAKRYLSEGRPLTILIIRDITERKRIDRELRRDRAVMKLLQDVAVASNEATSVDEALQVALDRVCELTGWPVGHAYMVRQDDPVVLVPTRLWHLDEPERYEVFRERTERTSFHTWEGLPGRILAGGQAVWVPDVMEDLNFPRADGVTELGVRSAFGFPVVVGSEVVGVLEFFSPDRVRPDESLLDVMRHIGVQLGRVVERHRAIEWLRSSEAQLAEAQQIARLGSWDIDVQRDIVTWSDNMFTIFGIAPGEFEATPSAFFDLVHPDDQAEVRRIVHAAARGHGAFDFDHRIEMPGGEVRVIHGRGEITWDPDGRVSRIIGTSQDVTERKRAEEVLRAAYERERQAADRLRAVDEMKDAFLTAVSHELRTPLTSVLGIAETLQSGASDDGAMPDAIRRDLVRRLARQATRLGALLDDLLDVDRLTRGVLHPDRQSVAVDGLLHQVVASWDGDRPIIIDADPVVAAVDRTMVERIVENLVANAVKYTPDGSRIWIRVRDVDGGVVIAVEDEGPGVPPAIREEVFQPFRQGPGTPLHSPGVGVGLSLVRRFAELHGGRAWVEDGAEGGASFRVFLPSAVETVTRRAQGRV